MPSHHGSIHFLNRDQLDDKKWDQCIDESSNGLIYGLSYYLDNMAPGWKALVMGDYDAVMPLAWRRKFGFTYLYQPPFTQQLGVFAKSLSDPSITESFLSVTKQHFRFAEIYLNYANKPANPELRNNFILDISGSYEQIAAHYKHDLRKNLKRAERFPFQYEVSMDYSSLIVQYKTMYGERFSHVKAKDYLHFKKICEETASMDQLHVRSVLDSASGRLAGVIMLQYKSRLSLVISVTTPAGRNTEATHYLLDRAVHEFAGKGLTLDFEGSDLPGIAHFYENFGCINQPYYFFYHNALPWPLKLFK